MTLADPALPRARSPRFFAGQLLTADDLNAEQDVDTGLRRLHNRMLHGWGIAAGLAVTGGRGGTSVTVGAGYALDAAGRELVVPDARVAAIPAVAGGVDGGPIRFTLVLRWRDDDEAAVDTRPGACATEGAVRRDDGPALEWREPGQVSAGIHVVLADVDVQSCRLLGPPDDSGRRLLNPPPTPYAGSGATVAGETVWRVRSAQGVAPWALWTDVDTSEAGFGDIPAYVARIVGPREVTAAQAPHGTPCLLDGPPHIEASEPGRFRVVVPLLRAVLTDPVRGTLIEVNPIGLIAAPALADIASFTLKWTVEWIGVQT
ncbi:hypothetical protein [Agromyces bracchium]|uniref:Uncharacterized protein n=1 Tax=Agromyces bracchium TaxID=88376 RepID=A0A6I3M6N7_9MICO|nr:hypothetical protein [Agromyces bracchium]MTH70300.1 hypothetical protein [Agromyces bracchium]